MLEGVPATAAFYDYSLSKAVFDLWKADPNAFDGYTKEGEILQQQLYTERKLPHYNKRKQNFSNSIRKQLRVDEISLPTDKLDAFAKWVWSEPKRCPALRLSYQVYHQMLCNLTDNCSSSDFGDFAHISCVPYVGAITLDNRMREYIRQIDSRIATKWGERVHRNLAAIDLFLRALPTQRRQ